MMVAKKLISESYLIVVKLREFLNVLWHILMVIKYTESLEQCFKEHTNLERKKLWQNWLSLLLFAEESHWLLRKRDKFTSHFIWLTYLYGKKSCHFCKLYIILILIKEICLFKSPKIIFFKAKIFFPKYPF